MVFFVILIGLLNYVSSLRYYFSQDDFIHLYSSHANNFYDFLNFFNPFAQYPDIFFYRPLGTQVYFFINQTIFGLNPLMFHIEALLLHGINGFLFYLIVKNVWQKKEVALLAAFFYTISAIHFLSLFYISAFQQLLRTFFVFLSILWFINFHDYKDKKSLLLSILAYIGALLSKETAVILPLLFFPIEILRSNLLIKETLLKTFKNIIPFIIVMIIYLVVRVIGFQTIFNEGAYSLSFSPVNIIQNFKWYLLWMLGLPEIIATYPSIKLDSWMQFIKDYKYGLGILLGFGTILISVGMILINKFNNFKKKTIINLTAIFIIPLLPILILSGHKYPQYLDLSLLAIFPVLAILCLPLKEKFPLKFLLTTAFIILQVLSVRVSESSHWTTHRADVADFYHDYLSEKSVKENSKVIFLGDFNQLKEVSFALAKNYALYVWYPGKIRTIEYLDKSTTTNIEGIIIPITKF